MKTTNYKRLIQTITASAILPMLCATQSDAQTAKTTKYTYDSLGRLTYVEDSTNGNRDYDYDAAGNRRNVAVGTADDAASEPPPLPPPPVPGATTGLAMNYVADCAWSASWYSVPTASNYKFTDTNGTAYTVTATNKSVPCTQGQPQSNKPYSVKACNGNGCGPTSYFQ
jgi:YD repeat-containing protein